MEQHKFDKDIKSRLEQRRLEPSKDAWNKLSDRLDANDAPRRGNPILWLGIAASLVGILLIVSQFFNNESREGLDQPSPTRVVKSASDSQEAQKSKTTISTSDQNEDVLFPTPENRVADHEINEASMADKRDSQDARVAVNKVAITAVSQTEKLPEQQKTTDLEDDAVTFEAQKIEDIVKNVQAVADSQHEVSDAYLDSLLTAAEKDIQRQKFLNKNRGIVDADALLADVENELDASFRTKVFDALKSSFNSVKTTVANRNN